MVMIKYGISPFARPEVFFLKNNDYLFSFFFVDFKLVKISTYLLQPSNEDIRLLRRKLKIVDY